jgi:uncharacterized protein (TIGR02646 family)
MLQYPKGPAPSVLTGWQATPNADWDSLSGSDKEKVREALLRDQGYLCAYCQRRIPTKDDRMKVEHWRAQSGGKDKLRWSNLLGVCLGDEKAETGSPEGEHHCDTARGDATLFLHPVEGQGPTARDHLAYTAQGEVRPRETPNQEAVRGDISTLNMNAERLRRQRRAVYEDLKQRLGRAGWTPKALREAYRNASIHPGTPALPHCEVVRHHVARWARQRDLTL